MFFLHNVYHSTRLKEDYSHAKFLLEKIQQGSMGWMRRCGDLKMVGFLLGLEGGFTKYSCFLFLWDSRALNQHYVNRDWSTRTGLTVGKYNLIRDSLILAVRILPPPLHIWLGLAKQFVN